MGIDDSLKMPFTPWSVAVALAADMRSITLAALYRLVDSGG
jgi:hypothetical protein